MDLNLSRREKQLAAKARKFVEEVLQPLELVVEEHGELPNERRPAVREAVRDWGFAGINHAKEHGGQGFTMLEQTVIEEQLGRLTNGLWTAVWRPAVCLRFGTDEQIETYLRPSNHGERRPCVAITEPNAGSDAAAGEATARLIGNQWSISGTKWFVTSYNASDYIIVQANVDGDQAKPTLFLVDKPVQGMTHVRSPKFMHNYAFDHAELVFDDARIPADRILGEVGQGLELTKDWFVEARLQIATHTLGAAERAFDIANDYAAGRVQFGRPIRDFQAVEFMLADMGVDIFAAKSMLYRVAWEIDHGLDRKLIHARASALKLFCSEMAGRVIDKALQILGGRGYMRENPVERLYRDIRVDRIWEGTSEIQRVIIAGQIKKRGPEVYTGWPG
jgi:alkylation response protein AidB-like acyl-CoA dehydrogenase